MTGPNFLFDPKVSIVRPILFRNFVTAPSTYHFSFLRQKKKDDLRKESNSLIYQKKFFFFLNTFSLNYFRILKTHRYNFSSKIFCKYLLLMWEYRSSRRRCSVKEGVLKDSANFTEKHLCWSLFLIKLQASTLIKRLQHRCFPVKFEKFLRTPILKNICERLLLKVGKRHQTGLFNVLYNSVFPHFCDVKN